MDEPLSTLSPPKTAAEYKAAIGLLLMEMRRLDAASQRTCAEIERIKAETRSIAARTDATLDRIDATLARLRTTRSRDVDAAPGQRA